MYNGPAIQIDNITKRYKSTREDSLSQVNLQINQSDVFGLLGPNGAGKTTLISILCGIISPSAGSVNYFIKGEPVFEQERRSLVGFVPQEYAFYLELSARQNLDYFGAMYNLSKRELTPRIDELLEALGLSKSADKKVGTFSGGMKRRVNLAIGLIHNPAILFLDEPTVGVDVQSRNAIIKYLEEINQTGTTIVYTSHHMSEAEEFCNRIALIDHGKVIVEGGLQELLVENEASSLQSLFIKLTGEEYRD
ncbi:ABC transporter ATP-binding protein [Dyadobacter frigoris]|uniref:ABC transporter ATP-binding protein n=1 Tax=Dyadobacter frigoris TaxID=2576211 RepID=A0A4V6BIP5_9BACT|nr:ABC transporter ATP-binding protein [Dyadobacter frigoris]TKT90883.1 ABC transporter ATP-binding protein [Dyadobacter frigoris]GLU56754.1 ABC transporter ATP-binding protein [Dyadobacter frigoris]